MGKKVFWFSLVMLVLALGIVGCAPTGVTKGYSADIVVKQWRAPMSGKMYFAGDKSRTEYIVDGKKAINIVRADKNVLWILSPDQKTYMEMKISGKELIGMMEKMPGEIERKKVGTEKVSGIPCDKYRITYKLTEKDAPITFYEWLSRDKISVKSAAVDGSWYTLLKNIKRGRQPASLFEVPSGYKKFEMPRMEF